MDSIVRSAACHVCQFFPAFKEYALVKMPHLHVAYWLAPLQLGACHVFLPADGKRRPGTRSPQVLEILPTMFGVDGWPSMPGNRKFKANKSNVSIKALCSVMFSGRI